MYVQESPLHGLGLFAKKDIEAGAFILEYIGPIISLEEAETYDEKRKTYLFGHYEEDKVIDGR